MIEKGKFKVVHVKSAENLFENKSGFTNFILHVIKINSFISYDMKLLENTCALHFFPMKKNALSLS